MTLHSGLDTNSDALDSTNRPSSSEGRRQESKYPTLKILGSQTADPPPRVSYDRCLVSGVFTSVFRGRIGAGSSCALKVLHSSSFADALSQIRVCEIIRGHSNLNHMIDAFVEMKDCLYANSWVIAFDLWENSLQEVILDSAKKDSRYSRGCLEDVGNVRTIIEQVLAGVSHMHSQGFIHADICARHVLVCFEKPSMPPGSTNIDRVCLCDFSSVVSTDPRDRVIKPSTLNDVIDEMPLDYERAPEIVFGYTEYDGGVDIWSIGVLLFKLGGCTFDGIPENEPTTRAGALSAYEKLLGSKGLLKYQNLCPPWVNETLKGTLPKGSWPAKFERLFGKAAVDMLDALLQGYGGDRPTASSCRQFHFVQQSAWPLVEYKGSTQIPGDQHVWSAVCGQMPHELYRWVFCEDPVLIDQSVENCALEWNFKQKHSNHRMATHQQLKFNRKICENGMVSTGEVKPMLSKMCGFETRMPSRFVHAVALARGVVQENAAKFKAMHTEASTALLKLPKMCANAKHFVNTPWDQMFLASVQCQVTEPGDAERGFWTEPRHTDCAGSAIHLAITGFSSRDVRFYVAGEKGEPLVIENTKGTMYMGLTTGCKHEVSHKACAVEDQFRMSGLPPCSLSIMVRCNLFPKFGLRRNSSFLMESSAFRTVIKIFQRHFVAGGWRMPSLQTCQDIFSKGIPTVTLETQKSGKAASKGKGVEVEKAYVGADPSQKRIDDEEHASIGERVDDEKA